MSRIRFYFDHSLAGYFLRRAREKWFTRPPQRVNHHGVTLQVDCLPQEMQGILLAGRYECAEVALIPGFITAEDKVLEIGGAIGFLGLYCRKIAGVKEFVSVEPNPKTIAYLRSNYELNGIKPVLIEAALAAADGPVQLQISNLFWTDSLVSKADQSTGQPITVAGLSFASLVERAGLQFNTLIIDIEGGEKYIAFSDLPEAVTKVLIEIHPEIIGMEAYKVLETLIRSGFSVQGHSWNTWSLQREKAFRPRGQG
jgi:FkbM family methyltransferase